MWPRRWIASRPNEIRWTLYGAAAGFLGGLLIGGIGVSGLGTAVGLPASLVLGGLGAMAGNRFGIGRDPTAGRKD